MPSGTPLGVVTFTKYSPSGRPPPPPCGPPSRYTLIFASYWFWLVTLQELSVVQIAPVSADVFALTASPLALALGAIHHRDFDLKSLCATDRPDLDLCTRGHCAGCCSCVSHRHQS